METPENFDAVAALAEEGFTPESWIVAVNDYAQLLLSDAQGRDTKPHVFVRALARAAAVLSVQTSDYAETASAFIGSFLDDLSQVRSQLPEGATEVAA